MFAAGDVAGTPQYVYVAAQSGHVAAADAFGDAARVDYRGLPGVTFTTPQLASAGWTEQEALRPGHACDCRVLGAQDLPRALVNHDTRGALKLVIDADTRKVLCVHAALDGAGDVMLAATYAITFGLTVDDLADTWRAVPDRERVAAPGRRALPLDHADGLRRMTRDERTHTRAGWLALLAVPVLCCVGHAVLLEAGVGSLTAVTGAVAGSTLLAAGGRAVVAAAVTAVVLRRRRQR